MSTAEYYDLPTVPASPRLPPPRRYSGRILGLDLARALAIFGMFYAHVGYVSTEEPSSLVAFLTAIPHGRSSILFALLAGISLAILTGRNVPYSGEEMRTARLRVFGRSCMLLVIAGFLAIFNQMILLILASYAAWFVAALPFARWNAKKLLTLAAFTAVTAPTLGIILRWVVGNLGFWGGDANGFLLEVFITGTYWGAVYMAIVLAGMGIGRTNLRLRGNNLALLVVGSALAIIGYGCSWLLTTYAFPYDDVDYSSSSYPSTSSLPDFSQESATTSPINGESDLTSSRDPSVAPGYSGDSGAKFPADSPGSGTWFEPDGGSLWAGNPFPQPREFVTAEPHSGTTFEAVGSGGVALAVVGLCLLIGAREQRSRTLTIALTPAAAVGSMSLTAYSAHVLFLSFKEDWFFTDRWAPFLWLVGSALVLCTLWKLRFRRGPLEWMTWKLSLAVASIDDDVVPQRPANNQGFTSSQGKPEDHGPERHSEHRNQ